MSLVYKSIFYSVLALILPARFWAQSDSSVWKVSGLSLPEMTEFGVPTRLKADSLIQVFLRKKNSEGYLDAAIDTSLTNQTIYCSLKLGEQYALGKYYISDNQASQLKSSDYTKKQSYMPLKIESGPTKILSQLENNGYPFASMALDSLIIQDSEISSYWNLNRGPFITIDSIIVRSSSPFPYKFIVNQIGIKKGDPYNESSVKNLQQKLKEIPFLEITKPVEIVFRENKALIYISIQKKKANYFNGIVGVRPNETTGAINITGDVEVRLKNAVNKGEDFALVWKRLQPQTQDLQVGIGLPFIFSTPLGIKGDVNIYRRDSTFSSNNARFTIQILFTGSNNLSAFVENQNTNSLSSFSTAQNIGNVSGTYYGLSLQKSALDYLYNPRKGYLIQAEASSGRREIFSEEGQGSRQAVNVYRGKWNIETYVPTFKKQTIKLGAQGAFIDSPSIFQNEKYRIGGLRTLRGIDEETIFAQRWSVATFEYRFLPEENTAFYFFYDQAFYENDQPFGFGTGINFQTKSGIFTFNYALGQQFENPILIRNGKISFGFRNIF